MFEVLLQGNESPVDDGVEEVLPESLEGPHVELVLALAVLLLGWYLSKVVVRLAGRTVAQRIERPSVTRTVLRGVRGIILLLTLLVVAAILFNGFELLLSVTVFSAVVGVILAPLVGSFINGIFVLADQPYEIGDMIEIADGDHRGFVEDITIRYTKIFTLENTFIVIPNSEIRARDVINYSAEDERTRISVQLLVTYESDVAEARRLAERAARTVDEVITGGPDIRIGSARYSAAPSCFIEEYADSGVLLRVVFWVKHPYRLLAARSAVQERVWDRYRDAGIEFAYPHQHHVFDETSGAARVAVDSALEAPTGAFDRGSRGSVRSGSDPESGRSGDSSAEDGSDRRSE